MISIVMTSYNYENYIKEAIESVIAQTYSDWELIIVDDGSKDNSVKVIESYCKKDDRIKLFCHQNNVNKGISETIKLGISKAKGEWIAFLESDDKYAPDCLEEKVKVIEKNSNVKFIFSDLEMFGDENEIKIANELYFDKIQKILGEKSGLKDLSFSFLEGNRIATFSIVMLQKKLLENLDFNSPIKNILDYYLWAQIVAKYKVYYLNKKLTCWRMHKQSYIHNKIISDCDEFEEKIFDFCNTTLLNRLYIFFARLKKLRRTAVRIRTGKNARLEFFGKVIYQKEVR